MRRGRHDRGDGPGVSRTSGGGDDPVGVGAGREWTRAGGRAQIQQGLAAYRAWRAARDRPYQLALLAEVSAQVGHTTEGLEAVAEALATVAERGALVGGGAVSAQGQLLLQHAGAPPEEAEACFQQALAVARRKQAKALELRGAMSLAGSGYNRASALKPMRCSRRSTAGSPRALIPPTSRRGQGIAGGVGVTDLADPPFLTDHAGCV